jgi:hypothetical protein
MHSRCYASGKHTGNAVILGNPAYGRAINFLKVVLDCKTRLLRAKGGFSLRKVVIQIQSQPTVRRAFSTTSDSA